MSNFIHAGIALVVYLSVFGASCVPAFGQHKFPSKADIADWKKYDDFSRSLQGAIATSIEHDVTSTGKGKKSWSKFTVFQNKSCASIRSENEGRKDFDVVIANPSYSAELRQKLNETRDAPLDGLWLLNSHRTCNDGRLAEGSTSIFDDVMESVSPHMYNCGKRLSAIFFDPKFQVSRHTAKLDAGKTIAEIAYSYSYDITEREEAFSYAGVMTLEKNGSWHITRINESENIIRKKKHLRKSEWNRVYEVELNGAGFPIIRSVTLAFDGVYTQGGRKTKGTITSTYKLTVDDSVPSSNFSLTYFGLREPVTETPPPPNRNFLWITLGAVGAVIIVVLVRRKIKSLEPKTP